MSGLRVVVKYECSNSRHSHFSKALQSTKGSALILGSAGQDFAPTIYTTRLMMLSLLNQINWCRVLNAIN